MRSSQRTRQPVEQRRPTGDETWLLGRALIVVTEGRVRVAAAGDQVEAVAPCLVEMPAGEEWTISGDTPHELLVLVLDERIPPGPSVPPTPA